MSQQSNQHVPAPHGIAVNRKNYVAGAQWAVYKVGDHDALRLPHSQVLRNFGSHVFNDHFTDAQCDNVKLKTQTASSTTRPAIPPMTKVAKNVAATSQTGNLLYVGNTIVLPHGFRI